MTAGTPDPAWDTACAEHQRSVTGFVTRAGELPEGSWEEPLGPKQWTPAQVAEHLRLSYQAAGRELDGGVGLRLRTSWWLRLILRFRFLPRILDQGRIPGKARAPSEVRPGTGPFPRPSVLVEFAQRAARVEQALTARRDRGERGLTHHVFGALTPAEALRFLTVHNEHHTRQLPHPSH